MAASTNSDSRGLVTTIMAAAPTNSTRLRSATDTEAPTADLICVVSAVSREISLAGLGGVEERRRQRGEMREHVAAQIGDDALAERGDEVVAQRAGEREHGHHRDHHARNSCRSAPTRSAEKPKSIMRRTAIGTASVVSAATTSATQRGERAAAVARDIGHEQPQRLELELAAARRPARRRLPALGAASARSATSFIDATPFRRPAWRRPLSRDNALRRRHAAIAARLVRAGGRPV